MANNYEPLPGATRTLWRPSIIINSAPVLWPSVRRQLKQLAAVLVRCWVARILQLLVPLQGSLLKLNICLPFRRASVLEMSMATKRVPLLEDDEKGVATFHRH